MRVCFLLFESLRAQLKFQLESYLLKLIELITYEGPNKVSGGFVVIGHFAGETTKMN